METNRLGKAILRYLAAFLNAMESSRMVEVCVLDAAAIVNGCSRHCEGKDVRARRVEKLLRSGPTATLARLYCRKKTRIATTRKSSEHVKILEIETCAMHLVPAKAEVGR